MSSNIKAPKKLIEVALPLNDINLAGASEKLVKVGKPTNLHLWWARRPLAVARAVIFAQMVNDPGGERGYYAGKTRKQADQEREKLFDIIRDLVKWENTNNESVLNRAREAIWQSWRETCELNKGKPGFDPQKLPSFHDPFAGGGVIPTEAQRLGLESYASDLNPVAVLINKAMIEIPPKFSGISAIGPIPPHEKQFNCYEDWSGAKGLAEDVRRYGYWIQNVAFEKIGHLYPKVKLPRGNGDVEATVISWIWARTVKSPNPAFAHIEVPLASTFILTNKSGSEAYIEPVVEKDSYRFEVVNGKPPKEFEQGTKAKGKGANFICLISGVPITADYIRTEAQAGRIGSRLMAVVAQGDRKRVYLSPTNQMEKIAHSAQPLWKPDVSFFQQALGFRVGNYGMSMWSDLYTPRQLVALNTFSEVIQDVRNKIKLDAINNGWEDDGKALVDGGVKASAYADSIITYLAFALSRSCDWNNSLSRWESKAQVPQQLFGRQAIPMVWDYSEANPFSKSTGSFIASIENLVKSFSKSSAGNVCCGYASQADAMTQTISMMKCVSTDPPYYDNIGYADLSDFFYVWLRRTLRSIYPDLFSTMAVPKENELVATPGRHGGVNSAEKFFLDGMKNAMHRLAEQTHPAFPCTIYYAFKQADTSNIGTASVGWETFIEAVIQAGFVITGTWPLNTENSSRLRGQSSNALASSIVLVCQKRDQDAETISRRQFQKELRESMPEALETMIGGVEGSTPIAPVDLAQAAIGPGMGIFSQYQAVLNQDGTPMSVHEALILINREITDYLNPDSGNFDNDTLFCSSWFDQYGWSSGPFGEADTLTRAKGTTVDGVKKSGVIESGSGKVKLMKWEDYPGDWDPKTDHRMPIWEACHHLIRALNQKGETAAGQLLARMPDKGEQIRQLAYHLYTMCERKKWAEEARAYNELITSWHGIVSASHEIGHRGEQTSLLDLM